MLDCIKHICKQNSWILRPDERNRYDFIFYFQTCPFNDSGNHNIWWHSISNELLNGPSDLYCEHYYFIVKYQRLLSPKKTANFPNLASSMPRFYFYISTSLRRADETASSAMHDLNLSSASRCIVVILPFICQHITAASLLKSANMELALFGYMAGCLSDETVI